MLWGRSTTPANDVQPAVVDKTLELGGQGRGRFVVVPLFVWEPGIGMTAHRHGCQGRE